MPGFAAAPTLGCGSVPDATPAMRYPDEYPDSLPEPGRTRFAWHTEGVLAIILFVLALLLYLEFSWI